MSLAHAVRRTESIEKAEAILLRAQAIHPKVAVIAFNLACYASVTGRMEEAKARLWHTIDLDKDVRNLAIDDQDLKPLWDWIGQFRIGWAFSPGKSYPEEFERIFRIFCKSQRIARIGVLGRASQRRVNGRNVIIESAGVACATHLSG